MLMDFTSAHKQALEDLFYKTGKEVSVNSYIENLLTEVNQLQTPHSVKVSIELLREGINKLKKSFYSSQNLLLSLSHGDFTPWNCFSNGKELFIFDWEMADYRPPLWDYFNFIYHRSILSEDYNIKKIEQRFLQNYDWAKSIAKDDYAIYHLCYLIEILLHYIQYNEVEKATTNTNNNVKMHIDKFTNALKLYLYKINTNAYPTHK
jgi:thiamine kinase-like enzyme